MSENEIAFDDWEKEAELITQPAKPEPTLQIKFEAPPTIVQPEDPQKALHSKLQVYKDMSLEQFTTAFENISEHTVNKGVPKINLLLKTDKDFDTLAKLIGNSLLEAENGETLKEENIAIFFEELLTYLYGGLTKGNFHQIHALLKIIKKERKVEEEKLQKQKKKEERQKKALANGPPQPVMISPNAAMDVFGGAEVVSSKQEEDNRKGVKVEEKKASKPVVVVDDDDFM